MGPFELAYDEAVAAADDEMVWVSHVVELGEELRTWRFILSGESLANYRSGNERYRVLVHIALIARGEREWAS